MTTSSSALKSTSASSSGNSSSFLTLILDLNPASWGFASTSTASGSATSSPISSLLPVLLVFLNSHLALSHTNGLAVYAASTHGVARLLYSTSSHSHTSALVAQRGARRARGADEASTYQHFGNVSKAVIAGVTATVEEIKAKASMQLDDDDEEDEEEETGLVKVLGMALSHMNRLAPTQPASASSNSSSNPLPPSRSTELSSSSNTGASSSAMSSINSRILILSLTPSASNAYIGLMNCIFAAQRREVPIDVLKIARDDTVFLQQAANLTGGIYFRLASPIREDDNTPTAAVTSSEGRGEEGPHPQQLLQLLLSTFLPPPNLRRLLHLPTLDEVDFRASCFCHGEIVDVGYVCGVCLSIFCRPPSKCFICNSDFPKKTLKRFEQDLTAPTGNS